MADDDLRSYWADVVPDKPVPHPGEPTCAICGLTQSRYAKQRAEDATRFRSWPEHGFVEAKSQYTSHVITICLWCNMHLAEHYEGVLEPKFCKRYELRLREVLDKLQNGAADVEELLEALKAG